MSEPTEEEQRRIAAHIATMVDEGINAGLAGDWNAAVQTIRPLFYDYTSNEAYAWVRAMFRSMQLDQCNCGGPMHAEVAQYDPNTGAVIPRNIEDPDVPTGIRILAQMMAAHANGDDDTVRALWDAIVANQDSDALAAVMQRTLSYAIQAARTRMAELS